MLQQTQVSKVIDYYNRFMARFPTVEALAVAAEDEVLSYWTGLGYYSRCRNLHKAAHIILQEHGGQFPTDFSQIASLPGVGSYTAGAIASFAFNQVAPVVDGNIARVLSRLTTDSTPIDSPRGKAHFEALSLQLAKSSENPALFHEGLMEIGATLCQPRNPKCELCPIAGVCEGNLRKNATSFPVKGKKATKKELHGVFAILSDGENVWLERNEEARLLKKLYAPPHVFVDGPDEAAIGLEKLSSSIGFSMPKQPLAPICVVRQLTHRIFHLYGFKVRASPSDFPKGNWMKREELSQIGLSSAILALLSKAQLLALLIVFATGCAHNASRQNRPSWTKTRETEVKTTSKVSIEGDQISQAIVKSAMAVVGKRQVQAGSRYFRRDCSGSVRGIFEAAGFSLRDAKGAKKQSDTKTLYDYVERNGQIFDDNPMPGDLVFFHNTYDVNHDGRMNDDFSHIGVVTQVDDDETITYVHFSHGRVIKSTMDDELRRRTRKSKGKTGYELFAGYGRLKPTS